MQADCPTGMAVTGLQTQVETSCGGGCDETALNQAHFTCHLMDFTPSPTAAPDQTPTTSPSSHNPTPFQNTTQDALHLYKHAKRLAIAPKNVCLLDKRHSHFSLRHVGEEASMNPDL